MQKRFEDAIILVTGASSGIGRATAVAFGAEGGRVVCAARRPEENETTLEAVRAAGGSGLCVTTDVSDRDQVEALLQRTLETYGRLDIAVNNAGVSQDDAAVADFTDEAFRQQFAVNVDGLFHCLRAEIRAMRERRAGAIVNIASITANRTFACNGVYAASKAAAVALCRSAAVEEAPHGIRINLVSPGPVATPMLQGWVEQHAGWEDKLRDLIPAGRVGGPDEVARAIVWLASPDATYLVGVNLVVDGGFSL